MNALTQFRIPPERYSGLIGAFLASHAISDAIPYLCTGIGCKAKITTQLGDHDRTENFTTRMGWAELHEQDLISGNLEKLKRGILGQTSRMSVGLIPVLSSPVVKTIGLEIAPHIERLRKELGLPLVHIPNTHVTSTVWEGYMEVMKAFCSLISWNTESRNKNTVNIWGYPFSRYEQDDKANITELRTMLAAVGLRVQSIFFSGSTSKELFEAHKASFNIILPHAYPIGEHITRRSARPSIYTDLPIGSTATKKWLNLIAQRTQRDMRPVQEFIRTQENALTDTLAHMKKKNKGRTAAVILERPWLAAIASLLQDIGIRTVHLRNTDAYYEDPVLLKRTLEYHGIPTQKNMFSTSEERMPERTFTVTHGWDHTRHGKDVYVLGFPAYTEHFCTTPRPLFGYAGMADFISRTSDR